MMIRSSRSFPGGAVTPWYLAGGAPVPLAVYEPIGAASLASSYVNLANPGTYDAAPGVVPTWGALTGWGFNGVDQYLTTGGLIIATANHAVLVRFSDGSTGASQGYLVGAFFSALGMGQFVRNTNPTTTQRRCRNGTTAVDTGAAIAAGVYGYAGDTVYLNGASEGALLDAGGTSGVELYIGAVKASGPTNYSSSNIQCIAIYPTSTDHATWVPAVSAAMAAL